MADLTTPLMVLLTSAPALAQASGVQPSGNPARWIFGGTYLAAALLALAFLLGYRLEAPVPEFVPIAMVVTALILCVAAVIQWFRNPSVSGN